MVVTIGWTTSVSLLLFLVYGLYEQELHPVTAAAYSSFSHTLWALGLAWVVIACSTGYGGRVLTVLHLNLGSFSLSFRWTQSKNKSKYIFCSFQVLSTKSYRQQSCIHSAGLLTVLTLSIRSLSEYLLWRWTAQFIWEKTLW